MNISDKELQAHIVDFIIDALMTSYEEGDITQEDAYEELDWVEDPTNGNKVLIDAISEDIILCYEVEVPKEQILAVVRMFLPQIRTSLKELFA